VGGPSRLADAALQFLTRRSTVKKSVAVLCAALFALTACGGGNDTEADPETAEAKENIKASLLEEGGNLAGTEVTDEQAGCVSDGMVDEVGVDKLQEYKLIDEEFKISKDAQPTDMEQGDAEAMAAVFTDCVDMEELFEEQFSTGPMADQLTDEQQTCLKDAVDDEVIESALADTFQGKQADPAEGVQADLMACVTGGAGGEGTGGSTPDAEE
jgi:hypothetical protein